MSALACPLHRLLPDEVGEIDAVNSPWDEVVALIPPQRCQLLAAVPTQVAPIQLVSLSLYARVG